MLVDLRTYTIVPGKLPVYLAVYQELGPPVQREHLGDPLGYFISETGTLNQVCHLWGYETQAEREQRRAALEADPRWQAYRKRSAQDGFVHAQQNQLMKSAPWSPI